MIHQAVKNLLDKYSLITAQSYENALKEIIQQTERNPERFNLDKRKCNLLLKETVQRLDIEKAKRDVLPFLKNKSELDIWSKDFFFNIISQIIYN